MIELGSHFSHAAAGLNHPCGLTVIALAQFLDGEKTELDQLALLFGAGGNLQIAFDDLPDIC